MPILKQYIFVIGSFQGVLLTVLLIFGSRINNASRILGVWCFLLALSFLSAFIPIDASINVFTPLIGWSFFLPASYGALLYLYCRHAIIDKPFHYTDLWHFLPFLLCYLLNLEILFASAEAKLAIVLTHPPKPTLFKISQLVLFSQAFVYIGFCVVLIRKYQQRAKSTLSSFDPGIFKWLWKLLVLNFIIWSLKVFALLSEHYFFFSTFGDALIIVLIYSIAMAQWRNPELFRIEQFDESPREVDDPKRTGLSPNQPKDQLIDELTNQNKGALNAAIGGNLLKLVRQHMEEKQTYLDSNLTLTRLAEAVGVSTHHLSEILNQHDGKNFYRFVNEYRVNFFCERLKADLTIKILDLAMHSGFSSKSTFNAVFKQLTGHTPSQYRNRLINELEPESNC